MKRAFGVAAVLTAVALAAAGCTSDPAEVQPSETPVAESVAAVTYDTVVELRDAAVAAGLSCPEWDQDDEVKWAKESGNCSDAAVLSVYESPAMIEQQITGLVEFNQEMADRFGEAPEPSEWLIGPNWVINADYPEVVQSVMGGEIRTVGEVIPPASPEPATYEPDVDDFSVEMKVLEKKCFGSAGCVVTTKPEISMDFDSAPTEGTIELTYEIKGDQSGPLVQTSILDLEARDYTVEQFVISTPKNGTKIKAEVISAEYDN